MVLRRLLQEIFETMRAELEFRQRADFHCADEFFHHVCFFVVVIRRLLF